MKAEEWRKLKQIGSLCDRLAELISENVKLFIAERSCLAKMVGERDPWYKPNVDDLETRIKVNGIQFGVSRKLLRKKIDEWLVSFD